MILVTKTFLPNQEKYQAYLNKIWNNNWLTNRGPLVIELEEKLKTLINLPYTILKHEAGVRPSVIDRRPVIGCHPKFKNIFVFNGLGTKGVMLAPYFANQFVENLKNGTKLQVDVDISRFST